MSGSDAAVTSRCPTTRVVSRSSGPPTIRYGDEIDRELLGVPPGVAGAADQPGGRVVDRLEPAEGARQAGPDRGQRCVDDDVHLVLPADGEVRLEQRHRVEVVGRSEGVVEHLDPADPVDPVGPQGVRLVRVAQEVPATVPDDERPRVDLRDPLRPGLGAVAEPHPSPVGAGLHQGARRPGVGAGGGPVGGGCRAPAYRLGLGRHRLRQRPHDLAERTADRVGGIAGVVVTVEHGHHQAERLGGAEHQRREAQAAADAVAAVRPALGLDRDAGLAQDARRTAGPPAPRRPACRPVGPR